MALIKDLYSLEITSESKKELQKFAKWFNKFHGNWPTVIGGWAVWSYHNSGFGSRDIDLVLPSDEWIETVMKDSYFRYNGIKKYRLGDPVFGEIHYGKKIPKKSDEDIIFFDLLSASHLREDEEGLGVNVDWNWIFDTQKLKPIEDDSFINVPDIELLISLKIIACLARIRTLHAAEDKEYWRSKIWKDCYDVANLTNHLKPIKKMLKLNFQRTHLSKELIREFLESYDSRQDVLEESNSTMEPLNELEKIFEKKQPKKKVF